MSRRPARREQVAVMRAGNHAGYVTAMAEGRRLRPATIPAKRGAGSYRRTPKHTHRITD